MPDKIMSKLYVTVAWTALGTIICGMGSNEIRLPAKLWKHPVPEIKGYRLKVLKYFFTSMAPNKQ